MSALREDVRTFSLPMNLQAGYLIINNLHIARFSGFKARIFRRILSPSARLRRTAARQPLPGPLHGMDGMERGKVSLGFMVTMRVKGRGGFPCRKLVGC